MQSRDDGKFNEKFNTDYDDSSDEEEEIESIKKYDVDAKWKLYVKEKVNSHNDEAIDAMLSFVAHAAGIDFLYSKRINEEYYSAKKKFLSQNNDKKTAIEQIESLIKTNIKLTFDNVSKIVLDFINHTNQQEKSEKQIMDAFQVSINEIMPDVNDLIKNNMRQIILWVNDNRHKFFITEPNGIIDKFILIFNKFIETYVDKLNLKDGHSDRQKIKKTLIEYSKNEVLAICKKYKFILLENVEGKKEAISLLSSYQGPFKNISLSMIKMLNSSNARGYVENMIVRKFEEDSDLLDLMSAYIDDMRVIQGSKKSKINKEYSEAINEYFSFDRESVSDILNTHLKINIRDNLKNVIKHISRPVLGKSYIFSSSNPITFYANVRLSNRSQKRLIQNLKFMPYRNVSVSRSWRLQESASPDMDVLETQEITSLNLARKDMVLDVGNYEKVLNAINQLKQLLEDEKQKVTDKDIASWIRSIFQGKVISITQHEALNANINCKIQSITYLLFGCEPIRNPAMLVINQMILDLIIQSDSWTFEEVFKKSSKSMPMIPEGAVSVARGLESDLRKYMPYPYIYNGIEENSEAKDKFTKSDLIRAEANILRAWLKLKNINVPKLKSSGEAERVLDLIKSSESEWLSNKGASHADKANNRKHRT